MLKSKPVVVDTPCSLMSGGLRRQRKQVDREAQKVKQRYQLRRGPSVLHIAKKETWISDKTKGVGAQFCMVAWGQEASALCVHGHARATIS